MPLTYSHLPSISYLLSFFLSGHPHPLSLHSFPTRRSSDLRPSSLRQASVIRCIYETSSGEPQLLPSRSEEHTSELQSLRHLVCRLLLEKKKGKKVSHTVAVV